MPGTRDGHVRRGRLDTLFDLANLASVVVVNMHEAKTRLSELVRLVEAGEKVVLARNGTPVAELVRPEPPKKRVGGFLKGQVWISPDFDDPLPEFEEYVAHE